MKSLLIVTQKVDEQDDLLGFFVDWIREFSLHFEKVFVITLAKGKYQLPNNVFVYSLGKESNNSTIARIYNFYKYLFQLVPKSSSIFAHMSPIFVIASWPITKLYEKKIILWYLHRSVTWRLKLAGKLVYKIVTANRASIMLDSSKIVEVGHGINVDLFFNQTRNWSASIANIISVGRISPIKRLETLIKAMGLIAKIKADVRLKIIGRPVMPGDDTYLAKLKKLVSDLGIEKIVEFSGLIPFNLLPPIYQQADLSINLAPTGGIDKVVLESMAAGALVLTANRTFNKYFGEYSSKLIFEHDNPVDLTDKIKHLLYLPVVERQAISRQLVEAVSKHHLLRETILRLSSLIQS